MNKTTLSLEIGPGQPYSLPFSNVVWVDMGEKSSRGTLGTLKFCLVGFWKVPPDSSPSMEELEEWAISAWRLRVGVSNVPLNKTSFLFEFSSLEDGY